MLKILTLAGAIAAVLTALSAEQAAAQGCGQSNPGCIVPTAPAGTSDNRAASTAFINGQTINPPAVQIVVNPYTPPVFQNFGQPFRIQETVTGTCSTSATSCYDNYINIVSDNAVIGAGTNLGLGFAFAVNHNFGGSAMIGDRAAGAFNIQQTAATGNIKVGASYSALTAYANAAANDNGTGVTASTGSGQLETINFIAHLGPSATNWLAVQGGEVDINLESGSSVYQKTGWQIAQLSTDAVQGAVYDNALAFTCGPGCVGWKVGIQFGGNQGVWPMASTGTVMNCVGPSASPSACGTVATVIDFSGATITSNFLNAPGFSVSGTGVITSGGPTTAVNGQITFNGSASGNAFARAGSAGGLVLGTNIAGQPTQFIDGGNGITFRVNGAGGTTANVLNTTSATTGGSPTLSATGTDTNVNLRLTPQGTGVVDFHYVGTSTCTVTASLPVQINGAAHQIPYC